MLLRSDDSLQHFLHPLRQQLRQDLVVRRQERDWSVILNPLPVLLFEEDLHDRCLHRRGHLSVVYHLSVELVQPLRHEVELLVELGRDSVDACRLSLSHLLDYHYHLLLRDLSVHLLFLYLCYFFRDLLYHLLSHSVAHSPFLPQVLIELCGYSLYISFLFSFHLLHLFCLRVLHLLHQREDLLFPMGRLELAEEAP